MTTITADSCMPQESEVCSSKDDDIMESDDLASPVGSADSVSMETDRSLTLFSLPSEILLKIISYLDVRFVVRRMSLVCKMFHLLVEDTATWKIRISQRWPEPYPIIPDNPTTVVETFNWKYACMQREEDWRAWNEGDNMEYFSLAQGHYAEIDTVHLMQNGELCISGSRDRSFHIWDLRKLDANNPEKSVEQSKTKSVVGHKGWVWDIKSRDNILCTSSWDNWMKIWDLDANCAEVQTFKSKSALLCSSMQQHVIYAGAYRYIYVFDRRERTVSTYNFHKKPVICIASDDDYIISGSEDGTIAVFDLRAGSLLKSIQLDQYPLSMSYGQGQLWVGRKDGRVNVIDPTRGRFDVVQEFDVGHRGQMTGILHSLGSVITCSTDTTVKIHSPAITPLTFRTLPRNCSTAAIHRDNGVLAAGGSDLCVGIWKPKRYSYGDAS